MPTDAFYNYCGGYAASYNAIVTATPSFQGATLLVRADHVLELHLQADLLRMFDGVTHVLLIAQNYAAGMFSGQQVVAN